MTLGMKQFINYIWYRNKKDKEAYDGQFYVLMLIKGQQLKSVFACKYLSFFFCHSNGVNFGCY